MLCDCRDVIVGHMQTSECRGPFVLGHFRRQATELPNGSARLRFGNLLTAIDAIRGNTQREGAHSGNRRLASRAARHHSRHGLDVGPPGAVLLLPDNDRNGFYRDCLHRPLVSIIVLETASALFSLIAKSLVGPAGAGGLTGSGILSLEALWLRLHCLFLSLSCVLVGFHFSLRLRS